MLHQTESLLAGTKVKIKSEAMELGNLELLVEDWWDRVAGKSWMQSNGNPACLKYAMRTGMSNMNIPNDNEVVYGKINGLGYLVHISELDGAF
jgi:hypothetical protein